MSNRNNRKNSPPFSRGSRRPVFDPAAVQYRGYGPPSASPAPADLPPGVISEITDFSDAIAKMNARFETMLAGDAAFLTQAQNTAGAVSDAIAAGDTGKARFLLQSLREAIGGHLVTVESVRG